MIASWPCPTAAGGTLPELAIAHDRDRARRLLVVPALFDEANRLRRFTLETMRGLDRCGIDSFLPDLPGTNESLQRLEDQDLAGWRAAMAQAARHFRASHVLTIRGGALIAPGLPGWSYAPVAGAAILRQMIRARIIAAREAGRAEGQASLLDSGQHEGLELGGYRLGPALIATLQAAQPADLTPISQSDIGGAGLWLRAEPDEDASQSAALADHLMALLA